MGLGKNALCEAGGPTRGLYGDSDTAPTPQHHIYPSKLAPMGKGSGHGHGYQSAWPLVLALPDLNGSVHNHSGT